MITLPYLCDSSTLKRAVASSTDQEVILIHISRNETVMISEESVRRLTQIVTETRCSFAYSDYYVMNSNGDENLNCVIDYSKGSVRDDFDFGCIVAVYASTARKAIEMIDNDLRYAAWYALRLHLSRIGTPVHVREPLYTATKDDNRKSGEKQFDYVNHSAREVQIEYERVATEHLKVIGAWIPERKQLVVNQLTDWPVEMSVIIPVKNRVHTIGDAIFSALDQKADFNYNVIVVDNHSCDGTTEAISRLCADEPRLKHIIPESHHLGIGGCWDLAIRSQHCGRYAVQLDSDDIYSSSDTLALIMNCFKRETCAMVIGSYSLTDFNLRPLPPGTIDHREWSASNGHNNALRINGFGAPRAFDTEVVRSIGFPNVSYGEDYAVALAISRSYRIGRIYDSLYLCRRWEGNSDSDLNQNKINEHNAYKDFVRTTEITIRQNMHDTNR